MVLLVGALLPEVVPLVRRLSQPRPLTTQLWVGRLGGVSVAILRCGVGFKRAGAATSAALRRLAIDHVISIGTCGALVDDLPVGSVVTASQVSREDGPTTELEPLGTLSPVSVVTVDRVVWSEDRRERLATRGHRVCEMEAAAVHAAAGERRFSAVKVVSDMAGGGDAPRRPGILALASFQRLALRLCEQDLAPALCQILSGQALPRAND